TRVALAGVITEQWDSLRLASRSRKTPQPRTRMETETQPSVVEIALRERLEALTVEVAARDQRIAQQDATIAALLAQLQPAAAPAPDVVLESEPQFEASPSCRSLSCRWWEKLVNLVQTPNQVHTDAVIVIPPRGFCRSETRTSAGSSSRALATSSRICTASASQNAPCSRKRER